MDDIGKIVSVASVSYRLIVGRKVVSDRSKEVQHAWCALIRNIRWDTRSGQKITSSYLPKQEDQETAHLYYWDKEGRDSRNLGALKFSMDLDKASEEEKVAICRKYFIFGFFLLPFFWLVNSLWFFKEAFLRKDANPKIRRYVGGSMIGTVIWTAALIVWTVVYQTQRAKWLPYVDYITLTVPSGIP